MKSTGTKLCLLEGLCVFATFPGAEKDAREKAQLTENLSVRDALSRLMRMPTLEDAARGICPAGSHAVLEPMVVQHASSSVLSRSFYVRYSEEDFDVNDTVVFQLEKVSVCTGKRDVAAVR